MRRRLDARPQVFDPGTMSWRPMPSQEEMRAETAAARARVGVPRVRRSATGSSLDMSIQPPGATASFTLRGLFSALRAVGVKPHGLDATEDEAFADAITAALSTAPLGSTEEGVTPNPALCVAEMYCPRFDPADPTLQAGVGGKLGTFVQMVADVARMGFGRIRRVRQCDICWASLFPDDPAASDLDVWGEQVPAPDVMLDAMRMNDGSGAAGGYSRFEWATAIIVTCLCFGVKVDLTPFNAGGGAQLNLGAGDIRNLLSSTNPDDLYVDITGGHAPPDLTWLQILSTKPAWQAGLLMQSGRGWDPWYTDWSDVLGEFEIPGDQTYYEYVLNVWPTQPRPSEGAVASEGAMESARRKALGVAAFAWGVGEWLALVDTAIGSLGVGLGIASVVEVIELCNETDGFFELPAAGDATATGVALQSAKEAGAYFALLAGPISVQVPSIRFRTEIGTWAYNSNTGVDDFGAKLVWLTAVLESGIADEVQRWAALRSIRSTFPPDGPPGLEEQAKADWARVERSAGFSWPPSDISIPLPSAGDLVHAIGVHWFHDFDTNARGVAPYGYADSIRLQSDVEAIRAMIATLPRRLRYTLDITVMATNFPAIDPVLPTTRYAYTTETFQAAMLVRNIVTMFASGVARLGVFTFAFGSPSANAEYGAAPAFTGWQSFASDGVHNDILYTRRDSDYSQGVDCWARPSWYALRRLSWILAQASSAGLVIRVNENGLTVLELSFVSPMTTDPAGVSLGGGWDRAYLIWLDQYATRSTANVNLEDAAGASLGTDPAALFDLLPLVPSVTPPSYIFHGDPPTTTDGNGYGQSTIPATGGWDWSGYESALASSTVGLVVVTTPSGWGGPPRFTFQQALRLEVNRADPPGSSALVPLCVLTNLTFLSSS